MEARVKIEVDNASSGICQQTLEDAVGVADAGGKASAVLPGEKRPASCSLEDNCAENVESEEGQWPLCRFSCRRAMKRQQSIKRPYW